MTGFGLIVDLALFDRDKEYQHSGMIDWLSLRVNLCLLPESLISRLQEMNSFIQKVNGSTGDIDWQSPAWDSIRSDTHQICFRAGTHLYMQGSPARLGLPNNAFGSLDIRYCAEKMVRFAEHHFDVDNLPKIELWTCSRIDITRNYLMQSDAEARQALAYLKQAPESRQKHSYESNGLYIGKRSTLQTGKIYLKGQDAKRCKKKGSADYTDEQIAKSEKLLRAELSLKRHAIKKLKDNEGLDWHQLKPEYLLKIHAEYFKEYFSDIEVADMSAILEKLIKVSPTNGQARAAYDCYTRIRMYGYEQAKETYTKPSWYRHVSNLKAAGFKRADLQMINVIPLKKRAIQVSDPVRHWDDIKTA